MFEDGYVYCGTVYPGYWRGPRPGVVLVNPAAIIAVNNLAPAGGFMLPGAFGAQGLAK